MMPAASTTPGRPPATARLARAGAGVLRSAGVASPSLDARILLAAALGVRRLDLVLDRDLPVPPAARRSFAALIRRRAQHEPVAYLVGVKEFRGLSFQVDPRVLVPRPETELLVETAVALVRERGGAARVLELGCGSGCVAVSIARACRAATIVATDLSPHALAVARANVDALAPGRVALAQGDLFAAIAGQPPFDVVVSNPPYVASAEAAQVDVGVVRFEPRMAWLAGDDPLAFHRRILEEGTPHFAAGAAVVLEAGSGAEEFARFAEARRPGASARVLRDLAGAPRVVSVSLPA